MRREACSVGGSVGLTCQLDPRLEIRLWRAHHAAAAAVSAPGEVEVEVGPPSTSSNAATTVSDKATGALRCAALRSGIGAEPRLVDGCEGAAVAVAVDVVAVKGECGGVPVPVPVAVVLLLRGAFLSLPIASMERKSRQSGETRRDQVSHR